MRLLLLFFFLGVSSVTMGQTAAPRSVGRDLMVKELPDWPGHETVVRANTYPPGTSNPPHRHDAHVYLHLVEGQLVVQLKGKPPVTLNAGDTYYESPDDIHVMSRNPSPTVPAKAIIFMVKKTGVPATRLVDD